MKTVYLFLFIIASKFNYGQIYNVKSGLWSDNTVWSTNTLPTINDDVILNYDIIVDVSGNCNSLRSSGHNIIINAGINLNISGLSAVTIGTQLWMPKNLDVTTYSNGDPIPQETDPTKWFNLKTGAWCYYNNDSATYANTFGKLYNWYAVNDPRGLAPTGWHVPFNVEWSTLTTFLGGDDVAGGAMKATTAWNLPNTGATNSSGFAGLPGGYRGYYGMFSNVGNGGYWWSSTEVSTNYAWSRRLYYSIAGVNTINIDEPYGFSVRCVRNNIPTITAYPITSIITSTATSGGRVISNGGEAIIERGICYNTSPNPTTAHITVPAGAGMGVFITNLTGLSPGTTYYVRTYATNIIGTAYGTELSFVAGQSYPTEVTTGSQVWATRNLDVVTYRNGDTIPQVADPTQWANLTTGAWCYYNNDSSNGAVFGKLYNWHAVNDPRGLAPSGWHVPGEVEWPILTNNLGGDGIAGDAIRATTGWDTPNTSATNSSGFSGLPGGYRDEKGSFSNIGYGSYWWTSTEDPSDPGIVWSHYLYYNRANTYRFGLYPGYGVSVRCVRD